MQSCTTGDGDCDGDRKESKSESERVSYSVVREIIWHCCVCACVCDIYLCVRLFICLSASYLHDIVFLEGAARMKGESRGQSESHRAGWNVT